MTCPGLDRPGFRSGFRFHFLGFWFCALLFTHETPVVTCSWFSVNKAVRSSSSSITLLFIIILQKLSLDPGSDWDLRCFVNTGKRTSELDSGPPARLVLLPFINSFDGWIYSTLPNARPQKCQGVVSSVRGKGGSLWNPRGFLGMMNECSIDEKRIEE